ncbi:MAG TPA: type II toxin-antitoxin system VapC family toxin [Longimicrobiaceae bacterium]|nr:type II toxin-antitoxin system VapC family toxin [Longimicrobiaceae bacterium]
MKLLLDTHVFLWWRENSPRLKSETRRTISSADTAYVSAASAWEIAIKVGTGKLRIPGPVEMAVEQSGFEKLPVEFHHAAAVAALLPHHGDPFDRMLVAQALTEGLTLVTHDQMFAPYGIPVLWT